MLHDESLFIYLFVFLKKMKAFKPITKQKKDLDYLQIEGIGNLRTYVLTCKHCHMEFLSMKYYKIKNIYRSKLSLEMAVTLKNFCIV